MSKSSQFVEKSRGTTDEMEVLRLIVEENPVLKQLVLRKLRMLREMGKTNLFEEAEAKMKVKTGNKRKKKKGAE